MNNEYRVALISFHTCPLASQEGKESGGMNIYVLELAKGLAKLGIFVDIYTRIQDEISPEIVDFAPKLRIIHLKAGPNMHIDKKRLIKLIPEFTDKLYDYIKKNNLSYSVIHCHYYLSGLTGILLNKLLSSPINLITTFHTLAIMKNLVARNEKERESKLRIDTEKKLTKLSNKIIATSDNDKQYLQSLYDVSLEKVAVVCPGVDTKLFHPINKKDALHFIQSHTNEKIILFVGRVEPLKGVDVLLYAIKIYLHKHPESPVKLLIVGGTSNAHKHNTNQELVRLKELQKSLNINAVVGFISQRPQHELPYYYNAAELVVMPSHYESFGMTSLEAMACGTSVIITDTSGISSIIDKEFSDLMISANNPLLLSNQIDLVINNHKRHEELTKHMLEKVSYMSWDNVAIKTLEIYKSLDNK